VTRVQNLSRRKFVSSAISATALSYLPTAWNIFDSLPQTFGTKDGAAQNSSVALTTAPPWRDQGILNLTKSPFAKLRSVPVHAVTIDNGFWSPRRDANVRTSIPSMGKLLEANGRMDNFRRLNGESSAPQRGPVYSDSDVYKWLEAVGFALQSENRPELRSLADATIKEVIAAQQPNGYLNTYYVRDKASQSMTPKTQQWGHELYNMGHMLQGGIAYYRATGDHARFR
jgi:uncharacterized protein